eukprot:2396843-Pleurochrysis_carterae.AAC.2
MAAAPLVAAFIAAAAGAQSPTATIAWNPAASHTASATAQAPKSSAVGMNSVGRALAPHSRRSVPRAAAVAAPR